VNRRRSRFAVLEELYRSGPSPPYQYVDDSRLFEKLDEFAENPTGLREWLEELAAEDVERAEMAIQALKVKYPDLHRILRKQDGGGFDSVTTEITDKEEYGVQPLDQQPQGPYRVEVVNVPEEAVQPVEEINPEDVTVLPHMEKKEMPSYEERRRRSNPRRTRRSMDRPVKTYRPDSAPMGRAPRSRRYDRGPAPGFDPESARRYMDRIPVVSPSEVTPMDEDMDMVVDVNPEEVEECGAPARRERPMPPRPRPSLPREEPRPLPEEEAEEEAMEAVDNPEEEEEERERESMHVRRSRRRSSRRSAPPRRPARSTMRGRGATLRKKADEEDVDLDMDLESIPEVGEDEVEVCEPVTVVPCQAPAKAEEAEEGEEIEASTTAPREAASPIFEPFMTREALSSLEDPEVTMFRFNEDTENPHYAVFANGMPVAQLYLKDQNLQPEYESLFLQDSYKNSVIEGIRSFGGLVPTLDSLNARWYAAQATEGEVAAAAKQALAADMEQARARNMAQLKGDLLNTISLALAASQKNYILQNALKDSLVSQMQRAGLNERTATHLVEAAWRDSAAEYFEEIIAKAEEWLGAPPEALKHHQAEIAASPYRDPTMMIDDEYDYIPNARMPITASVPTDDGGEEEVEVPRSVPLHTAGRRTMANRGADFQEQVRFWSNEMRLADGHAKKYGE